MTAAQRRTAIDRDLDNCIRLRALVKEVIANPTQANIDAVITGSTATSQMKFRLTHSLDGESYGWTEYAKSLLDEIKMLRELQVAFAGPFEVRSSAVPY